MSKYENLHRETKSLPEVGLSRLDKKLYQQRGSSILNLSDSFVGDDGCELVVRYLCENPGVSSLDLRGNGITSAGLSILSVAFAGRSSLRSLSLEWNNIGDDISVFAEALSKNLSLQSLDLRNNRIGAEGASILAKVLETNSSLLKLDLRWNEIGLQGGRRLLTALSRTCFIRQLDLAGNKIPEDLLLAIEKALKGEKEERFENFENFEKNEKNEFERFERSEFLESPSRKISTPVKQKDFSYNGELFTKYEALMIQNARSEARIKELEILLEQEARKVVEVRYELTRDLDIEKNRRAVVDENFLKFKEECLRKEVENSRVIQEFETRISRMTSEKNVIIIEFESLQGKFENFNKQTQEHIQSLQEKIEIQDKEFRVLQENSRNSLEGLKVQNEEDRYQIIKQFEHKLFLADEQVNALKNYKSDLEAEVKNLKNQIVGINNKALNDLNDLELAIREEESLKLDKTIENYESHIKNLEESRESLHKKSQDLHTSSKSTEKKLSEIISSKESDLSSLKQEISEQNKQLQKCLNTIENLRTELNSSRLEIEKVRSENEDLNKSLKERKEVFLSQIEQISQENSREKNHLQDKIEDLSCELHRLELELGKLRKDKERIIHDHEYLNDTLKMKVSNLLQESILSHVRKLQEDSHQ
jgi:chromosome segregation ATPase